MFGALYPMQDQAQNIHKVVTDVYKDMIPTIMTDPEPWTWTQGKLYLSISCMGPWYCDKMGQLSQPTSKDKKFIQWDKSGKQLLLLALNMK